MIGERLAARAAVAAERRCRAVAADLAREARATGVAAAAEGHQLVLSGRGLTRRWLGDARLRFLGWLR